MSTGNERVNKVLMFLKEPLLIAAATVGISFVVKKASGYVLLPVSESMKGLAKALVVVTAGAAAVREAKEKGYFK